jgi:hypothetical protein
MLGLDGSQLADLGSKGLLAVGVLLIFTGQLVPGREMRYWRRAFFAEQEARRDLQHTGTVTRDVLRAIPETPPEGRA